MKFPLYNWFMHLNFWKKLLILLTLQIIIILFISNVLLFIIFEQIINQKTDLVENEEIQFQKFSANNILESVVRSILAAINLESDKIEQLTKAYHYLKNNPQIFTKQNKTIPFEENSEIFGRYYDQVGFYFSSGYNNSIFKEKYDQHAQLDDILSTLISKRQIYQIRRINIIYQSNSNPKDIFVRTVPKDNTFMIRSINDITQRMKGLVQNQIITSSSYTDELDSSNNGTKLIALQTIINQNNTNILFQIQAFQQAITVQLSYIYFFPQSELYYIYMLNQTSYQFLNDAKKSINLTQFLKPGLYLHREINGFQKIVSTLSIPVSHEIGAEPILDNSQSNKLRFILIIDSQKIESASQVYQSFLQDEQEALLTTITLWSLITLLLVMSLAGRVGSHIFSSLTHLSENLESYTKNPSKQYSIIIKLKEMQTTGITKKLTDSLITIIQRIEFRKKQAKDQIQPLKYPLNMAHKQFTNRMGIDESQIVHQLKQKIKKNNESVETNDKKYQKY